MRTLRILLLLLAAVSAVLLSVPASAQVARLPDCFLYFNLDADESGGTYDNRQVGCADWSMVTTNDGFGALTVTFEQAPDNGNIPGVWAAYNGTTLEGVNPIISITAGSWRGNGYRSYLRVTASGTAGAGNIRGIMYGYRLTDSATGGGINVTVTNTPLPVQGAEAVGAAATEDPVPGAVVDPGGLIRYLAGSDTGVPSSVEAQTLADGVANTLGGLPQNENGVSAYPAAWPYRFNGTTWDREFSCAESAVITLAAGTTEIVPLAAGEQIRVCKIIISWDAVVDLAYVYGTGANCATGTTALTGTIQNIDSIADDLTSNNSALLVPSANALCVTQTGVASGGGYVVFARY